MKTNTLEVLIWVLIYGGLLAACLGLAVQRTEFVLGLCLLAGGGAVALVGFALIYVRSQRND